VVPFEDGVVRKRQNPDIWGDHEANEIVFQRPKGWRWGLQKKRFGQKFVSLRGGGMGMGEGKARKKQGQKVVE